MYPYTRLQPKWHEKYTAMIAISFITLPMLFVIALSWWPLHPLELKSVKVMNFDNRVTIGQPILFQVHYIKHIDKHGIIIRQLVNDRVINYTPIVSNVGLGESKGIGRIKTSAGDIPGKYHIKYSVVYEYWGFRDVVVSALSDEFELVENDD